jgi:hypothetical protein
MTAAVAFSTCPNTAGIMTGEGRIPLGANKAMIRHRSQILKALNVFCGQNLAFD